MKSQTLTQVLDGFQEEEILDEKVDCERCGKKQRSTKKLQIWKLPFVLVLNLKRFEFNV